MNTDIFILYTPDKLTVQGYRKTDIYAGKTYSIVKQSLRVGQ